MKYVDHEAVGMAEDRLLQVALSLVAEEYQGPGGAHHDDAVQYLQEQVALAARDLVLAVAALPEDMRPVGW